MVAVMMVRSAEARRWCLRVVWAVVCAGVGVQVWASVQTVLGQGRPGWDAIGVMLGYFTVLTNLLVAAVLTVDVLGRAPQTRWWVSAESAVALQIAVVGMSFHLLLRAVVEVTGAQRVSSEWLHYVNPILYVAWWLLFVEKGRLRWADAAVWLVYPGAYVAMVVIRGAISGFYPYWFVDVSALGYARAGANMLGFTAVFLVLGWVVVWVDRLIGRQANS